ncbi:hypothetical protein A5620_13600 [Mycobacterium colombiense]|nr:hypothetical protein A5620_13600 [Mycobacterium colombiense]
MSGSGLTGGRLSGSGLPRSGLTGSRLPWSGLTGRRLPWSRLTGRGLTGRRLTARGLARRRLGLGALGRHRVEHRPDVEASGLAQVAGLVAVVPGDRDDQVVAVDDDLRTGDAEPVDPGADDLLGLRQRLTAGLRPVRGARGQRDAGAALQVDTELGSGPLVPGEKHQQVDADEQ